MWFYAECHFDDTGSMLLLLFSIEGNPWKSWLDDLYVVPHCFNSWMNASLPEFCLWPVYQAPRGPWCIVRHSLEVHIIWRFPIHGATPSYHPNFRLGFSLLLKASRFGGSPILANPHLFAFIKSSKVQTSPAGLPFFICPTFLRTSTTQRPLSPWRFLRSFGGLRDPWRSNYQDLTQGIFGQKIILSPRSGEVEPHSTTVGSHATTSIHSRGRQAKAQRRSMTPTDRGPGPWKRKQLMKGQQESISFHIYDTNLSIYYILHVLKLMPTLSIVILPICSRLPGGNFSASRLHPLAFRSGRYVFHMAHVKKNWHPPPFAATSSHGPGWVYVAHPPIDGTKGHASHHVLFTWDVVRTSHSLVGSYCLSFFRRPKGWSFQGKWTPKRWPNRFTTVAPF